MSGNPRYRRGRALEYLIKDKLEKQGYFVVRAAGSHGVADVVAIRLNGNHVVPSPYVLFVSCKIPQYAPPAERKALLEAAERCGAVPMITEKNKQGEWILTKVES